MLFVRVGTSEEWICLGDIVEFIDFGENSFNIWVKGYCWNDPDGAVVSMPRDMKTSRCEYKIVVPD